MSTNRTSSIERANILPKWQKELQMRTVNMTNAMNAIFDDAVEIELAGPRSAIYVDIEKVNAIPAAACINGDSSVEGKLKEAYGYLRNQNEKFATKVFNNETEKNTFRVKRLEIFAVDNLDAIAEENATPNILHSAGDPVNRGKRTGLRTGSRGQSGNSVRSEVASRWASNVQ